MKKIAYIFDGTLEQFNSVRDILYNILKQFDASIYEQIIISHYGTLSHPLKITSIAGFKTYRSLKYNYNDLFKSKELSFFKKIYHLFRIFSYNTLTKIPRIRHIYSQKNRLGFIHKILKHEKPDIVIYYSGSPQKGFSEVCKKRNIPYISILYDTYIERPYITPKEAAVENDEIANAIGYFVPDFFANGYYKYYDFENIHSFSLPLLISKEEVMAAYNSIESTYKFSYFGQMQSFRNSEGIKEIFKKMGFVLNVFSTEKKQSDDVYIYHNAVSGHDLNKVVASSDFLVAFDNGVPYAHYLPSKAYLYVSFTKPIIVFGNNKSSALKSFLEDYPLYYYHNTEESSLEELNAFISSVHRTDFNEVVYSKYEKYLPKNATKEIVKLVKNTINSNTDK